MNILTSILKHKCPACHKGNLFEVSNPYQLTKFDKMPDNCHSCGQKYMIEPAFFYGAMYVSYGLTIAEGVAVAVAISVLFPNSSALTYVIAIISTMILLIPICFRLSRSVWIHLFIKDKSKKEDLV